MHKWKIGRITGFTGLGLMIVGVLIAPLWFKLLVAGAVLFSYAERIQTEAEYEKREE